MDGKTHRVSRVPLTRRGFLGGLAATAGAAILAACGDANIATDTPRPAPTMTTGGVSTAASMASPTAAAATRPAVTAAPTAATAMGITMAPTAAVAGTAVVAGAIAPPPPDKFKGQKLAMISRQEYFSGTQKTIDAELQAWAKQLGAEIETTYISTDDGVFVTKQDAAVKAGNPPDIQYLDKGVSQFRQLDDIVEVTDVVEELQRAYGPVEDALRNEYFINGKWWAIPFYANASGWFARKDWLDEKGIKVEEIKTFENARDIALAISDPAKKRFGWGLTMNKSGDANGMILDWVQAYGGAVNGNDGAKVTFNSPETVAAITTLSDIYTNPKYRDMIPPGIESWNDTGNNEAWLAGTIGLTKNGYTLYAKSKADKNPIYDKTATFPGLVGPGTDRIIASGGAHSFVIFKGAKSAELAKATAKHLIGGMPFLNISKISLGLILPAYKKQWDSDPFYTTGDPAFPTLRRIIQQELPITSKTGLAFPQAPSPGKDQAVNSEYILTDMMGEIITRGVKPAEAVKTAHDRIVKSFQQLGLKQ